MKEIHGANAKNNLPALYERVRGEPPEGTIPDVAKL
jgi:hypothetical protein